MQDSMYENSPLYLYDAQFCVKYQLLCGVDEAGRGPLCGPVAVGAVILNMEMPIGGLKDSKKLSEKKRELLYEEICETAIAWNVVLVHADEIDRVNILQASLYGMQQAVLGLPITPSMVLVDGNQLPSLNIPAKAVVKGDAVCACVAAASVLAKVSRDRFMCNLAKQYPQYMLNKHKGYPTKLHYELLSAHGVQSFYRKSFLKKWRPT